MKINKPLDIAAGILMNEDDQVLICQRKEETSHPLKWEFPGGKIEDGETPREALRRELVEELAVDIKIEDELVAYDYTYPNGLTVNLTFYMITDYLPDPMNLAFADIRWVDIAELDEYDFLDGDQSVINLLKLTYT
ncbi:MAG: 8-oxo-dGTP diphosphatase MutT [Candidatus Marinimicrobia bacterium]|nr:8-oxo-dGTP diphosphatase MutT [Candidatus Neomarinimicrobiota bacterium]MCF7828048.1 8-oxo-dGTP diphosphatase MutT [Candidatus Neomarinimicrobiota bacterium]MCF7879197.1 8-oxo-dGTP diphosphatase MutT [Candidatus Neomarinimicrobiota bacterium]